MHKMSLIVVGNGPNSSAAAATKGSVIPSASHGPSRPPPAHVTQLTSSPHVVQHHPLPAPSGGRLEHLGYSSRPLPLSPQRTSQPAHHARHRSGLAGSTSNSRSSGAATPCLPQSPLPYVLPSPAHQLLPSTSVNSPSLIPQNIPPSFLPHLTSMTAGPHSPQLVAGGGFVGPLPSDSTILPPNAFKKLTRNLNAGNMDDDVEVTDPPHYVGRRNFISPRQRDRRNCFSSLALQDHNYCAAPPPSPARSPTPPPSPFSQSLSMGVQPSPAQEPSVNNDDQSFTFGIAGYKTGSGGGGPSLVGAYPSPHYSGAQVPMQPSPLSRLKQTIQEAGVGPMTPLGEEESPLSGDKSHESRPSLDGDGGEETETAPEADDETVEDSVTRCICEYLHDDGYMICCDKCTVWQHVVCMGLDKNNIPDEYLCEKCQPRPVDKKKAKALQRAREKEIFARLNFDSSDDEKKPLSSKTRKPLGGSVKKPPASGFKKTFGATEKRPEKKSLKKTLKRRSGQTSKGGESAAAAPNGSGSSAGVTAGKSESVSAKKLSPRKGQRRKSSVTDIDTEEENVNDTMALRSWIDTYEEAVTNHYSPELRARLQGAKLPNNQFKPKDVNGIRCNVSLRGNGMKVLTANSHIPANTPVIECRGKYMLASQLAGRVRAADFVLFHRISPDLEVCVESKTYGNDSRFCRRADSALADYNAEVKHHLDKGSLHLYIVSTKVIEKNQEILLPPENKNGVLPPLSIKDELRQIKKLNGLLDEKKAKKTPNLKRRVKREIAKKEQAADSSSEDDMPVSLRKTRSTAEKSVNFDLKPAVSEEKEKRDKEERGYKQVVEAAAVKEVKPKIETHSPPIPPAPEVKLEPKVEAGAVKKETLPKIEPESEVKERLTLGGFEAPQALKIEIDEEEEAAGPDLLEREDQQHEQEETATSAGKHQQPKDKKPSAAVVTTAVAKSPEAAPLSSPVAAAKSPGKPSLGLPDQSGLIVGVNTINYDVALRNKSKTREEKKMEMILKAIEAMERAEARKRSDPSGLGGGGSGVDSYSERSVSSKRRRSSSTKKESVDSAVDASSADEGGNVPGDGKSERPRISKSRRRRNPVLRRRSRAKSGDSTSAMSADEGGCGVAEGTPNADSEAASTPGEMQPFKFPRHKKQLASESFNPDSEDVDDDVSSNYLRGSRSPPGIANHLLRSAVTSTPFNSCPKSPTKNIGCSAKKRWLRAAMSEDHSEEGVAGAGGASPEPDCTPLKKRRLATYKEAAETVDPSAKETDQDVEMDNMSKLTGPITDRLKSLPNGLKERLIPGVVRDPMLEKAIEEALPKSEDHMEAAAPDTEPSRSSTTLLSSWGGSPNRKQRKGGTSSKRGKGKKHATEPEEELAVDGETVTRSNKSNCNGPLPSPPQAEQPIATSVGYPEQMEDAAARASSDTGTVKESSIKKLATVNAGPADHCDGSDMTDGGCPRTASSNMVDRPADDRPPTIVKDPPPAATEDRPPPTKEDRPPAPVQHSVFKSFFNTDLSIDDIDRQIEAKRMEWARESAASLGLPSNQESRTEEGATSCLPATTDLSVSVAALNPTEVAAPSPLSPALATPGPKKRVTIADYKRRREASRTDSCTERDQEEPQPSSPFLSFTSGLSSLPVLTSLPELPGLETRRPNHQPSRAREASPKRGSAALPSGRKHEKWESKSKETHSKARPAVPSGSNSKKSSRGEALPVAVNRPTQTPLLPAHMPDTPPVYVPRPPIPTPDAPREDLTERLRKEFGLSIEDSEEGEDEEDEVAVDNETLRGGGSIASFVGGHRASNHVGNNSGHNLVSDTKNSHGWAAAATTASQRGMGTANHGGQQRSGSSGGRGSPGHSSNYWGDVSYRNSFRHT